MGEEIMAEQADRRHRQGGCDLLPGPGVLVHG
jgi:hypothetical protein